MENNYIIEDVSPFKPEHFEDIENFEDDSTIIISPDDSYKFNDIINSLLVRNDSETSIVQESSVHTIDDLYNINFCILIVLVVMLLLKAFHGIIRNIMRL